MSLGRGSRVVAVRLLGTGGWHANHAVTVVDRRGATRRLVLRRWARPGWDLDDPDFTAAREKLRCSDYWSGAGFRLHDL